MEKKEIVLTAKRPKNVSKADIMQMLGTKPTCLSVVENDLHLW